MAELDPSAAAVRLPAFARLRPRARIPYVAQLTETDCGPACLAIVLAFFGKEVPLDELRRRAGSGRDGSNAATLLTVARSFGLRTRAVSLDIDDLDFLSEGSILHWEFQHFVVFERLQGDGVDVVDPARGRRHVPMPRFRQSFTGVALLFEPSEDFTPARRRRRGIARQLGRVLGESRLLSSILVTALFAQICALALPAITRVVVDRIVPRGDHGLLEIIGIGVAVLVGFNLLNSIVRAHPFLHLRTRLNARMTLDFLEHLVALPYAFFQERSPGDLMLRLNSNGNVREILTSSVLSGALDGVLVCLYLVLLLSASPSFGLLVLALGLIRVLLFVLVRRRQRELLAQSLEVQARFENYQVEMLTGIEELKSMGIEERAVERWSHLFVDTLNNAVDRGKLSAFFDSTLEALALVSSAAVLLFGAFQVLSGQMSLGTMLALSALAAGFLSPLSNLVASAAQLQLLGTYLERINEVFETPREQQAEQRQPVSRLTGRIAVENLSFRYGPAGPDVVDGVSLDIEPGQMLAVVGASGSGKSTLGKLLIGLYPPASGRVLYDGRDLRELDHHAVRSQWGIVTQSIKLFGGTVRSNIALADPTLELDQVVEAAKLACLHDEIMQMPMGYDTPLSDGGLSLSGGQRQRLALARALARRPALLLLDEASSSLDARTELEVQRRLSELDMTRVVIAHRLSTIRDADLILVLQDGRIVERGTHVSLIGSGGPYSQLVAAQARALDERVGPCRAPS